MEEELIEMELKEVKAIEPDKILEDGSFEDFVSQEEKWNICCSLSTTVP